ncbi:cytidine deaminase [Pseudosporangium ferrugineum]|uniref:Cytidine deaminase n=1 Tax=Pseudosporangium ferrugineum TaxID=439699 RepID=A0A2T0RS94_9ACTN|nr:cytidine deaminase [Pseudosporangium ferrugineum]PRY23963.1 hypothetical protein CLV70_11496 [Pseudosporangium ferrugineum]
MPDLTIPGAPADTELSAEDAKLVTLARGARARVGAAEGASVRDQDGRTYAAATVSLPHLRLTALQLAVASAVAAGATKLEAAALATGAATLDADSHAAVRDLASDAPVHVVAPDGTLLGTVTE